MSGIAGVFYRDGRPVQQETIDKMVGAMKHRGPDGIHTWREGSVALGHCMLQTTPESASDQMPASDKDKGVFITSDSRIDNRQELGRLLRLCNGNQNIVKESEIIISSYKKWSTDFPNHIVGEFAIALWDESNHRLILTRDQLGVRPLYFALNKKQSVFFSSEIKTILGVNNVHISVNEERVIEYIFSIVSDKSSTFFTNIYRVEPGQTIVIDQDRVEYKTYYNLPLGEMSNDGVDEAVYNFSKLFRQSVDRRCSSIGNVGSYLSGGLDSSSIAAELSKINKTDRRLNEVVTISATFGVGSCDETSYINSVIRETGLRNEKKLIKYIQPSLDSEKIVSINSEPVEAHPLLVTERLNPLVIANNIRTIFDGHGGDEVAFKAQIYRRYLAEDKKLILLYNSLNGRKRLDKIMMFSFFLLKYTFDAHRLRSALIKLYFNKDGASSASRYDIGSRVVRDKVINKHNIRDKIRSKVKHMNNAIKERSTYRQHILSDPLQVKALEELNNFRSYYSTQTALPFWDRDLVEYSLSLPMVYSFGKGLGRQLLRESMKGRLPDYVRLRNDKTDFKEVITKSIRRDRHNILNKVKRVYPCIGQWFSNKIIVEVSDMLDRPEALTQPEVTLIWRVLVLGEWMVGLENN